MRWFYELPMANLKAEELLEKEKIRCLVEYERYCADCGYKEQQADLWFEDGIIFTTWFKGSFSDYQKASPVKGHPKQEREREEGPEPRRVTAHKVNHTVVWLNGSRAVAELLCGLSFRTRLGAAWVDLTCNCRMHYRVEKRTGTWGILSMEGIYEKDRMKPVFGDEPFAVSERTLRNYRPCNWNMAARRDLYEGGLEYADRWAGADRPKTVERLYRESSIWLEFGEAER